MKKSRVYSFAEVFTKEYLLREYVEKGKSTSTIAKKHDCHYTAVLSYLHKHNITVNKISKEGSKKKSKVMSDNRKSGKCNTWNKGMDMWTERPELVLNMKAKLKGKRCNKEWEFKKGHKLGLSKRKNLINKHHIDLNRTNGRAANILFLTLSAHNSLHRRSYDYLVETGQIQYYIEWFIKKYKPDIYNKEEYIILNKALAKKQRMSNE